MNKFNGYIKEIQVNGDLSLISIHVSEEINLQTIVIETPETANYLGINNPVKILFKETEVIIGKGSNIPISVPNKISGIIKKIKIGTLLSHVNIDTPIGEISSIISTQSINQLDLKTEDLVVAMVKLNEVMISE